MMPGRPPFVGFHLQLSCHRDPAPERLEAAPGLRKRLRAGNSGSAISIVVPDCEIAGHGALS
jgi:hypothetical protein